MQIKALHEVVKSVKCSDTSKTPFTQPTAAELHKSAFLNTASKRSLKRIKKAKRDVEETLDATNKLFR